MTCISRCVVYLTLPVPWGMSTTRGTQFFSGIQWPSSKSGPPILSQKQGRKTRPFHHYPVSSDDIRDLTPSTYTYCPCMPDAAAFIYKQDRAMKRGQRHSHPRRLLGMARGKNFKGNRWRIPEEICVHFLWMLFHGGSKICKETSGSDKWILFFFIILAIWQH